MVLKNRNKKQISTLIVSLLIVLYAIKVIFGLWNHQLTGIEGDEHDYMHDAALILEQGPFMTGPIDVKTFVGPGFPWLLALAQGVYGTSLIIWANALLSVLTILLVYRLAQRYLSSTWAILPAVWAAIYVPYTMYVGSILKESLLQFLVPLSFLLAFRARKKDTVSNILLATLVYVYLIHTDERFIIFLPLYLLLLLNGVQVRSSIKKSTLFTAFFVLFCIPWAIRNYLVYDRPVFLTERLHTPIDKRLGIQNDLNDLGNYYRTEMEAFRDSILAGYVPEIDFGREAMVKEALANGYIPHDFNLKERLWYNTLGYWSPIRTTGILISSGWKYIGPRSLLVNVFYTLNYGILLPFMLIGIFFAYRNNVFELKWMTVYLFLHYLFHIVLFFGSGRYRHPIDFIIILLAFYGLFMLLKNREYTWLSWLSSTSFRKQKETSVETSYFGIY